MIKDSLTETTTTPRWLNWRMILSAALGALAGDPAVVLAFFRNLVRPLAVGTGGRFWDCFTSVSSSALYYQVTGCAPYAAAGVLLSLAG